MLVDNVSCYVPWLFGADVLGSCDKNELIASFVSW